MILESAIAAEVASYFTRERFDVLQEVEVAFQIRRDQNLGSGRVDLVPIRDNLLGICEVKRELSVALLLQASKWRPMADRIWIAFPGVQPSEVRDEGIRIALDFYGFGVLEVCDDGVHSRGEPRVIHRVSDALLNSLSPEHRTHAQAGGNRGGQFTSFKGTCEALAAFVAANPASKLEEAVACIKHHYRDRKTAVAALDKAIGKGLVPNVYPGRKGRLYSTEEEARPKRLGPIGGST